MGGADLRILVHAPNHLGDIVMALPGLQRVRERYPAAAIDVAVRRHVEPVLEMAGFPWRRISYDPNGRWIRTALALRSRRYDLAFLFAPSLRAALFVSFAGARVRRGSPTQGRRWLLTDVAPPREAPGEHRASFYLRIADPAWAGNTPPAPRLAVDPRARATVRAWVGSNESGPVVGIFPGSKAAARRWDVARFVEVARRLAHGGAAVWVFGGRAEAGLTARVAAAAGARGRDVGGRTTIPWLAAALAECDVLLTNDTGPMHFAAAVGTPVVAIFGSSDPRRTGPLGVPARVLWRSDLPCVPCLKNRCPRTGRGTILPDAVNECLNLIGVEEVVEAVDSLLRASARS